MTRPCPRMWLVEAVRDGRVTDGERRNFHLHVQICSECARESRAVDELGALLRQMPGDRVDELSVRRSQQLLLAEFDATILSPRRSVPRALRVLVALIAASLGVWMFQRAYRTERKATAIVANGGPEIFVDVQPGPNARWSQTTLPDVRRITVIDGTVSLSIQRPAGRGRVIIELPDGEIEDIGTRLTVTVRDQHTVSAVVHEGSIALRLRGREEQHLGAGESWVRPPAATASSMAPGPSYPATDARPRPLHARAPGATDAPEPTSTDLSRARDSTEVIAERRAEDRAYIEVVKLLRAGREADARKAASAYIMRFPTGFRRSEMLDVATGE
jgi:hypothetical protein